LVRVIQIKTKQEKQLLGEFPYHVHKFHKHKDACKPIAYFYIHQDPIGLDLERIKRSHECSHCSVNNSHNHHYLETSRPVWGFPLDFLETHNLALHNSV
jgi:hypothetical protein